MKPTALPAGLDPLGLEALATALLDPRTPRAEQARACEAFHAACLAQIPVLETAATQLASGKALSPADAARCVLDPARTPYYLRAVDAAIAARREVAPTKDIEVLYAGCGPLAPLALPLAHRFRRRGVRFTLVDVHASSLACAQALFERCGVSDALRDAWCADAAELRLPADYAPDILVAEVMQRALAHEPQVAVVANLVSQCSPQVVMVPARITVSARLGGVPEGPPPDTASESIDLGTLLDLSLATLPMLTAALAFDAAALPEQTVQVPHDAPAGLTLMLHTRIETAPGFVLADYDSGLTYPLPLFALGAISPGERLAFTYRLGRAPGFHVRRLPAGQKD